jgi:hypothetical protein
MGVGTVLELLAIKSASPLVDPGRSWSAKTCEIGLVLALVDSLIDIWTRRKCISVSWSLSL